MMKKSEKSAVRQEDCVREKFMTLPMNAENINECIDLFMRLSDS